MAYLIENLLFIRSIILRRSYPVVVALDRLTAASTATPLFRFLRVRILGFLYFTHPTYYHIATGLALAVLTEIASFANSLKALRSGVYLTSCSINEYSAITIRGVLLLLLY